VKKKRQATEQDNLDRIHSVYEAFSFLFQKPSWNKRVFPISKEEDEDAKY